MKNKIFILMKRLVMSLCMLYTFNILMTKTGLVIPINIYSIGLVSILDIFGIAVLFILKILLV